MAQMARREYIREHGSRSLYEAVTRGIRVSVTPHFLEDHSRPEDDYFCWAYTVVICNEGRETVRLLKRYWRITNGLGESEDVRGPGVVGETPEMAPGESFTYTSGCPLRTPSGIMVGSYELTTARGKVFEVAIPAFSLDSPFSRRTIN